MFTKRQDNNFHSNLIYNHQKLFINSATDGQENVLWHHHIFFFFFWVALGLQCCARAFSSCSEQGLLFVAVCGLLIEVASLVAEHGL